MKNISKYFKIWMVAMALALVTTSCIFEDDMTEGCGSTPVSQGNMVLLLNIHPLVTRNVIDATVTEKIQSLRIIIIDSDNNEIEENKLLTFSGSEAKPVESFQYFYTMTTKAGNKRLILLANEESVGEISYKATSGITLPDDLPDQLTELLDGYQAGSEADAATLYNILNTVYFAPDYEINGDSEIYLPYVALYEEEITPPTPDQDSDTTTQQPVEWTTYMVPIATKFTFIFNNYREFPINVNKISLKNTNLDNYLIAHVGNNDLNKTFEGVEYYWIDWLAKVAEASADNAGFSQNEAFNTKYGWISDYDMPSTLSQENIFLIAGEDDDYGLSVAGAKVFNDEEDGETIPSTVSVGPFYVPESQNFMNVNTGQLSPTQIYFLTFVLEDTNTDAIAPLFEDVAFSNLGALFRDTSVFVILNFKAGEVEVYAEIADWNTSAVNGWLEKGETPDFLKD